MSGMDDAGAISRRALLLGGAAAALAVGAGAAVEWDNPTFVRLRGGCGDTPPVPPSSYQVTSGTSDSDAMGATVPWSVALPDDHEPGDGTPLVLCLTGLGADPDDVMTGIGFPGFATAAGLRLAFAAPGGGGNLYWHSRAGGRDPLTWAVHEFVPMVEKHFGVGGARDRRGVLGWSMGGAGALLVAQLRPDLVSAAAALSPAVFPSYDAARSGHPYTFDSERDWSDYGVWDRSGLIRPPVRIDCGDADPFAPAARTLLKRIPGAVGGISPGCHDVGFWRRSAPTALRFLDGNLSSDR
jgi:S-formylglutathione hydrolase FrmB